MTRARLIVRPAPALGPDITMYAVDCQASTTQVFHVPGPLEMAPAEIASVAVQQHGERCGSCSLSRAYRQARLLQDLEHRQRERRN